MVCYWDLLASSCILTLPLRSFLGQAPLCLIAFGIVYFMLELPEIDQSHWKEKLGNVDFLGAFSLIVAVATSLM
jgi:hypothetical protein